jgi:hypothetical protein
VLGTHEQRFAIQFSGDHDIVEQWNSDRLSSSMNQPSQNNHCHRAPNVGIKWKARVYIERYKHNEDLTIVKMHPAVCIIQ